MTHDRDHLAGCIDAVAAEGARCKLQGEEEQARHVYRTQACGSPQRQVMRQCDLQQASSEPAHCGVKAFMSTRCFFAHVLLWPSGPDEPIDCEHCDSQIVNIYDAAWPSVL